ncbi:MULTISPECIES: hypothetical protein [unclassified Microbacterium]|uniref:hypothetical protein n=1 Tax=unclassified Microbacterium TaxID=2609290 RepID=UPI002034E9A5|nr:MULTISPECIES: hypothetical protein [unclassified Microbacterium]
MPKFHDPLADAAEASEALRGLAHASRVFDDPADTYAVFGELTAGVRSLRQVLGQLGAAHLAHQGRAFSDAGSHTAGTASALGTADELHHAGTLLDQASDRLDAAFSHSGRIAWHPEPSPDRTASRERLVARLDDTDVTTVQVGTLTLAVWPDTPVGEHQRYAYRITDTTTGQEVSGRDLFTGAGIPVEPDRAIRDLAGYLGAAAEARQYAFDHPGSAPENAGLFPVWVADAARTNLDALSELSEHGPSEPETAVAGRRWFSVVFLQGEAADRVLDVIDRDGTDAAISELAAYDYGAETQQSALENGYVYDDQPPTTVTDKAATADVYTLTFNHTLGHVGLYRQLDALPDPALPDPAQLDIDAPAVGAEQPHRESMQQGSAARRAAPRAEKDWFAPSAAVGGQSGRGLSL